MHRSRIGIALIDHPVETYDAALSFWAGVQGVQSEVMVDDDAYARIGLIGSVHLEGQRVGSGTTARVHFDIETDDVAAEIARVVGLGATVVRVMDDFTILADPGGLVFCVVPVQTGDRFEADSLTWP